jgi:hypothetical protein
MGDSFRFAPADEAPQLTATTLPRSMGTPVFFMDDMGHIRPMRPDDQPSAGALWAYNTETRHFEMIRNTPTIDLTGTGTGPVALPTIDLNSTTPRPIATLGGRTLPIITLDSTGPRPTLRFVR